MKIENVRTAKASLNRLISDHPRSSSVIITKNGKPCAALMPITEDTDLEVLAYLRTSGSGKLSMKRSRAAKKKASSILQISKMAQVCANWTHDQR